MHLEFSIPVATQNLLVPAFESSDVGLMAFETGSWVDCNIFCFLHGSELVDKNARVFLLAKNEIGLI